MNIFQAINGAATFLILSAVVAGMAKHIDTVQGDLLAHFIQNSAIVYLGLFLVVFRVKTLLDDHRHFGEIYQDKSAFRYVGFVLAILSWLFWGLAAYLLASTVRASELMATSILISTLWVAVHVIEILVDPERRNKEVFTSVMREKWVLLNMGYMLCLVAHVGWFQPLVIKGATAPLLVLLVVLLFDVLTSRSFRGIVSPEQTGG